MKLNRMVLYAHEPVYRRTVDFYSALLDTDAVPEQHAPGLTRHAITGADGLVIEVYPTEPGQRVQTSTRLGFTCAAELAVQRLMDRAYALPERLRDGTGWWASDPLGNTIVLIEELEGGGVRR